MLVQVQSSLLPVQYSCSVKVRFYMKACFITGCTVVSVPRVLVGLATSYISYRSVVALWPSCFSLSTTGRSTLPTLPRQNCGCFEWGLLMCCDYYLDAAWRVGHFSAVVILLIMAYFVCLGLTMSNTASIKTQVTFFFGACMYLEWVSNSRLPASIEVVHCVAAVSVEARSRRPRSARRKKGRA